MIELRCQLEIEPRLLCEYSSWTMNAEMPESIQNKEAKRDG